MKTRMMMIAIAVLALLCLSAAVAEAAQVQAGTSVTFGFCEQDYNPDNGPEPIEWMVLDVQEGKALLLSRYGLEVKTYKNGTSSAWASSDLRTWLKEDFYRNAFTDEDRDFIRTNETDNGRQEMTEDVVFLLSYDEAFNQYFPDSASRMCLPTETALAHGAKTRALSAQDNQAGSWWLRSGSESGKSVMVVGSTGDRAYERPDATEIMVRPALWLDVSADAFAPWTCLSCGRENDYDSAFCPWCGGKKPAPEAPQRNVVCPGCGAVYAPDTEYLFCKKCGTKLTRDEAAPSPTPAPTDPAAAIQGTWVLTEVTGTDQSAVSQLTSALKTGYVMKYTFSKGRFTAAGYNGGNTPEFAQTGMYRIHDGNIINLHQDYWEFGQDSEFLLNGDTLHITFEGTTKGTYYIMTLIREE